MKRSISRGSPSGVVPFSPLLSQAATATAFNPPRREAPAFAWSWKLATVAGIHVYVHGTFLLLLAFLAFGDLLAGKGIPAMVRATLLLVAVFTTVLIHEFGHALMARRFGVRTHDITLLPIGGVARLEKMPERPRHQLLVAAAGPVASFGVALLLFGVLRLTDGSVSFASVHTTGGPFLTQLMWINVSLGAFNLLPGYPMDGGRILRALLAMRMEPERATQLAARVGQSVAVIFGVTGLFLAPFLIVIAVFVWIGAQVEHSMSTTKVALAGLSVRDGMLTDFKTVSPTDPLSRAVTLTLAGFQQDFPVMDGAQLVGILTHRDLLKGLAEGGKNSTVQEVMRGQPETVRPTEPLDGALTRIHQAPEGGVLMVVEHGKVLGILTSHNIAELMALDGAVQLKTKGMV